MPLVSEEMRHQVAMLSQEVLSWPGVTTHPMFGLRAVYRDGVVFGMLPDKRAFQEENGVAYKEDGHWKTVPMAKALPVLERTYEAIGRRSSDNPE